MTRLRAAVSCLVAGFVFAGAALLLAFSGASGGSERPTSLLGLLVGADALAFLGFAGGGVLALMDRPRSRALGAVALTFAFVALFPLAALLLV